jgi:hypothetical protein
MGEKKKMKEKAEKPLEARTIKELREEALKIQGVQGIHGMNKEELLQALRQELGIPAPEKAKGGNIRELKKKLQDMRTDRDKERAEGADRKRLDILRRKIAKVKKLTKRAA